MPVKKSGSGYKWGTKGKVYRSKSKASKQGKAIKASQSRKKKPAKRASKRSRAY